jgi:hypothetical protein
MEKVFDAPEWLAAMTSHVPNKGEQMVRYYDHYSNKTNIWDQVLDYKILGFLKNIT